MEVVIIQSMVFSAQTKQPKIQSNYSRMNALIWLKISKNKSLKELEITGYSVYSNKTKSFKSLIAYDDASNLAYLPNLQKLSLTDTSITDLFPLRLLKENGCSISVWSSDLKDYSPLSNSVEAPITFGSKAVETLVRKLVGMPEGELCYSNVKNITALDLSGMKLTKVDFLKYFTGLKELNLSGNAITSLEPIRYLTNLEVLNISGNKITTLEPIRRLPVLRELYAASNLITTTDDIEQITTLEVLDITKNKIKDISGLMDRSYAIQAAAHMAVEDTIQAAIAYRRAGMPMESVMAYDLDSMVAAEGNRTVLAVSEDGKVLAGHGYSASNIDGLWKAATWEGIKSIYTDDSGVYALTKNGALRGAQNSNCTALPNWQKMKNCSFEGGYRVGVTQNGTVQVSIDDGLFSQNKGVKYDVFTQIEKKLF